MSTVSMTCPKCGAPLKRKNELFFTHCPYCGVELAFDEIDEESTDQVRKKIVEWKKKRDIYYNTSVRKPLPTHVGCGMNRFFVLS